MRKAYEPFHIAIVAIGDIGGGDKVPQTKKKNRNHARWKINVWGNKPGGLHNATVRVSVLAGGLVQLIPWSIPHREVQKRLCMSSRLVH